MSEQEQGPPPPRCDHGVAFDERAIDGLTWAEVRDRWPRLCGPCPKGCGYDGIAYASHAHMLAGAW